MATPKMREWLVTADGWVGGQRRKEGERLEMSDAAARHEPLLKPVKRPRKAASKGGEAA